MVRKEKKRKKYIIANVFLRYSFVVSRNNFSRQRRKNQFPCKKKLREKGPFGKIFTISTGILPFIEISSSCFLWCYNIIILSKRLRVYTSTGRSNPIVLHSKNVPLTNFIASWAWRGSLDSPIPYLPCFLPPLPVSGGNRIKGTANGDVSDA